MRAYGQDRKNVVQTRLNDEEKSMFDAIADDMDRTFSDALRLLIKKEFKRRGLKKVKP